MNNRKELLLYLYGLSSINNREEILHLEGFLSLTDKNKPLPSKLKLRLIKNTNPYDTSPYDIRALAKILESGRCQKNTIVDIVNQKFSKNDAVILSYALKSGKCPIGLQLKLDDSDIEYGSLIPLFKALESGRCPIGLKLSLKECDLEDGDFMALIDALKSGKCPTGLQLDFEGNEIKVEVLAEALKSGNCPEGLSLNLEDNRIGEIEEKALIDALESGSCPPGLQINMEFNAVTSHKVELSLKQHNLKKELQQTALACVSFQQGLNQLTANFIARLPQDLANTIYKFILPSDLTKKQTRHVLTKIKIAASPRLQIKSSLVSSSIFRATEEKSNKNSLQNPRKKHKRL